MTRAKDISKIITDADFSGTLDVTGTVTANELTVDGVTTSFDTTPSTSGLQFHFETDTGLGSIGSYISGGAGLSFYTNSGTDPLKQRMRIQGGGDISFYEDTGTTPKFFWDSSAECLNVGTTTSEGNFNVNISTPSDYPFRLTNTSATGYGLLVTAGDGSSALAKFRDYAGNDRVYISGAGNVGIGTTSPTNTLQVTGNIYASTTIRGNGGNSASSPNIAVDGGTGMFKPTGNTVAFSTTNAERMRITSGGNVGIGTSSPNSKLRVQDSDTTVATLESTGNNSFISFIDTGTGSRTHVQVGSEDNDMVFHTNDTEAMRINESGNLLVGTTNADIGGSVTGIKLAQNGSIFASTDETDNIGNAPYYGDRRGTNNTGDILGLALGGYFKASIGVLGTNNSTNDGGITFNTISGNTTKTERMRIKSNGSVHIANSNVTGNSGDNGVSFDTNGRMVSNADNDWNFEIYGARQGRLRFFTSAGGSATQVGSITTGTGSTAYNTTSDHRLKENVTADWDATTRLKQLNPVRFNFITDADTTVDGFLAHEVQSVVPEAITGTHNEVDDDGNPVYQGIDQSKLVPLLVKTIQELEARITALETA